MSVPTIHGGPDAPPTPAVAAGAIDDVVVRSARAASGLFPLWPLNRIFANLTDTDDRIDQLLRAAGVHPGRTDLVEGQIAATDVARLLRQIARLMRDETWGLRPVPTPPGTFVHACQIAVHAHSVEQGLRAAFGFYHTIVDDFTFRLRRQGEDRVIVLTDRIPQRAGRDMMHILFLNIIVAVIEWLSGQTGFVRRVEVPDRAPPGPGELDAVFGAPFCADAAATRLTVCGSVLRAPIVVDPSQIRRFPETMLRQVVRLFDGRRGVADRAAGFILNHGGWDVGRDETAVALGMASATFNRHLHAEIGVGFQALKDRMRFAAAIELLSRPGPTLDEVARMLGFAELSSFHRAFKRWSRQAPGSYRDAGRH